MSVLLHSLRISLNTAGCHLHRADDNFLASSLVVHRRFAHVVRDLEYVWLIPGTSRSLVSQREFLPSYKLWLDILSLTQHMD